MSILRAPRFWWRDRGLASALLAPLGAAYGAIAAQRMRQQGARIGVPIVCVGNFTLGGAGKTPTAIALAQMLTCAGERPVFLTRGYGGRLSGPVRVDTAKHRAEDVGDEPLLLARLSPTIVAHDRRAGAEMAREAGASVIVMDDGFQNPALEKDCALLVVDAARGIGNAHVCPAGPLRAPLKAQIERAHALLIVGSGDGARPVIEAATKRGLRILRARIVPDAQAVAALRGRRVLAFAGIGDPEKFFRTLADAGIEAPVKRPFADHHRYSAREAEGLLREAEAQNLLPLSTEKDLARLCGESGALALLRERARALPARLAFDIPDQVRGFVLDRIRARA